MKDGPRRRNNRKGKGEAEKKVRNREQRCDKIADLLVAGKKGQDLEAAIRAYDSENVKAAKVEDEPVGAVFVMHVPDKQDVSTKSKPTQKTIHVQHLEPKATSKSPDPIPVANEDVRCSNVDNPGTRFVTPLTAMFKRSSSAPASYTRTGVEDSTVPSEYLAARRHSVCSVSPANNSRDLTASPPFFSHEVRPRAEYGVNVQGNVAPMRDSTCQLSPLRPPLLSLTTVDQDKHSVAHAWTDVSHMLGLPLKSFGRLTR